MVTETFVERLTAQPVVSGRDLDLSASWGTGMAWGGWLLGGAGLCGLYSIYAWLKIGYDTDLPALQRYRRETRVNNYFDDVVRQPDVFPRPKEGEKEVKMAQVPRALTLQPPLTTATDATLRGSRILFEQRMIHATEMA